MLVGNSCFDHPTINEGGIVKDGFSQTQLPNCSPNLPQVEDDLTALSMEYQQKLNLEMEQCYNCINNPASNQISTHLMQEMHNKVLSCVESNWEDMNLCSHQQQDQHIMQIDIQPQSFTPPPMSDNSYTPTADLLNMLPFPRDSPSSLLPNSSISFSSLANQKGSSFLSSLGLLGDFSPPDHGASVSAASVVFDPLLPVNLPPQPPLLRELMQYSLPQGYNLEVSRSSSLFNGVDVRDGGCDGFYQDGDIHGRSYENGVFKFTAGMNCITKGREAKDGKHYTTEKQRRVQLNGKYEALGKLVPNPSKSDKATVLQDAIDYINELKMRVGELKILVAKKRCSRIKRQNIGDSKDVATGMKTEEDMDQANYNGSALRSSWIHRKSKTTEVDVRIIDDEVTVKLVQQKKINCLLFVSQVLDELQLDLHHVAGGLIGDYYCFLLNSKISEGSTVHTQAIANRIIEVVDKQYAAVQPTGSY